MTTEDNAIVIDTSYFMTNEQQQEQESQDFTNPRNMLEAFKEDVKNKRDVIEEFTENEKQELFDNSFKFIESMRRNDFFNAEKYLKNVLSLQPTNSDSNSSIETVDFEEVEETQAPDLGGARQQNRSEVIESLIRKKKKYF